MPVVSFDALPDSSRLWIFAADRALNAEESKALLAEVDAFLAQWKAHGHPLTVAREWKYDRFLLVGVDEASAGASGPFAPGPLASGAVGGRLGAGTCGHGERQRHDRSSLVAAPDKPPPGSAAPTSLIVSLQ